MGTALVLKRGQVKVALESVPWTWQVEILLVSMREWFQKDGARQSQTTGVQESAGKDGRFPAKRRPEETVI